MGEEMNLDKMKVAELRQLAKELGLKGYSSLKKADLIDKIASHQAEEPAVEEAPAEEPAAEEAPAEEPAAEETPAEEPAAEEAPAEEPAAEEAPAEEPAAEETPAEEPAAEEPAPEAVVLTPEMIAIKKEKRSLKGQIADAISAGDSEKTKDLRKRKKEIRRLLKRKMVS
jgi:hypothetical protein